jgi:hypothetical protein
VNYWLGIGGVFILQLGFTGLIIMACAGNGSFVGLGVMLLAVYTIPVALLANFFLLRRYRQRRQKSSIYWVIVSSALLPLLQLALWGAQRVWDL